MSTLGAAFNISNELDNHAAVIFAQWIGCSNVIRNAKIRETTDLNNVNQAYSHLKTSFDFLKNVPPQILRNATTAINTDFEATKKGLRKFPKIKSKHKKRSAVVTSELFSKQPIDINSSLITIFNHAKKNKEPIFSKIINIPSDKISNQIRISRQGTLFTLSLSYDDGIERKSNNELLDDLAHLTKEELEELAIGMDRNIVAPAYMSTGVSYVYNQAEIDALKKEERKKRHYQKKLNNVKNKHKKNTKNQKNKNKGTKKENTLDTHFKGSNQKKLQDKITKCNRRIQNIRNNACHQWSKKIADNSPALLIMEELNLKGMTKRAKPKRSKNGRGYERNNQSAKSGLNRALLNVSLSKLATCIKYKLNLQGKAWLEVNPAYTSKIHHECGGKNTSRPIQSILICHDCNKKEQADHNAAKNIETRGIQYIVDGTFLEKRKTSKSITKKRKRTVEEEST